MKGFFLLNFKVYFDHMKPILAIFCGLMTFMMQAQTSNNYCDSIIIHSCQPNATGEQIEVIVSNYDPTTTPSAQPADAGKFLCRALRHHEFHLPDRRLASRRADRARGRGFGARRAVAGWQLTCVGPCFWQS